MRKTVDLLGWISVVLTIISLLVTSITKYILGYADYYKYYTIEWCILFMMLVWAVKLFNMDTGKNKYVYPAICLFFALGSIFFLWKKIY